MVDAEMVFEAYLNAAVPYIDLLLLDDPIIYTWRLKVKNQSNQTIYFKLFNAIPNWDFGTSLPGSDELELGAVGAGAQISPIIDMARDEPVSETYDGGNLTLKAYDDAGYSHEIASADKFVTIDIQDIENWTDVEIFTFQEDDAQGWTLSKFALNSAKSVEADGYSLRGDATTWPDVCFISRSISIPNRNKCNMSFFYVGAIESTSLEVFVDGVSVFIYPYALPALSNWIKFSVNLSPYKGQTKTIKINIPSMSSVYHCWIDRIVIAGKD